MDDEAFRSLALHPFVVDGLHFVQGGRAHHLHGADGFGLEDVGKGMVGFLIGDSFEAPTIQRDDVEGCQTEPVPTDVISQGRGNVGAAGPSFFPGHVEFGGDDGLLDAGVLQAFHRHVEAGQLPGSVDAARVEQDGITVLVEEDLEMSVDLACDAEFRARDTAAELRAFHQHELAGDVLLVVDSLLAEVFRDFHGIRGI